MLDRSHLNIGYIIFNDNKAIIGKIKGLHPNFIELENPFNGHLLQPYDPQVFYIYDQLQILEDGTFLDVPSNTIEGLSGWKLYYNIEDVKNSIIKEKIFQYEILILKKKVVQIEEINGQIINKVNSLMNGIADMYSKSTNGYANSPSQLYNTKLNDSNRFLDENFQLIDFYPKLKEKLTELINNDN